MNLFVETRGRGSDVVLLHGWGLHGGVFGRIADALESRFCLHAVDLPGHGASPPLDPFDAPAIADALAGLFPFPVQVVGWSLGGYLAQHWAARHPHQVKSLALVSTSPCFTRRGDWPHAQEARHLNAVADSLDDDFDLTLERFLALQMLGAPEARETLRAVRDLLFAHGRPAGLKSALALLLDGDGRSLAPDILCPVGLFHGARDAITPIGAAHWLRDNLTFATLHEFPRASHAPFLSHESEFVTRLAHHLESNA
ncbi:pimeloyl-ACP methyl ester esterase BioH [Paludibacterium paludis]|uniref:Pimeloyl-[acyl-carrier protein] methyl ester esterase n=1 Tax=Paludibacterium paludis TaxID=1225769 RepID=A0A918U8J2_9NEIS|nr:pimeloyl-ACP methyl ester esterase BioH [Paludibacterium paludis]GGY09159.1 pimeloyl-[acyl-carrier protein] methyl ester esterase [Paludibacterium paludis]